MWWIVISGGGGCWVSAHQKQLPEECRRPTAAAQLPVMQEPVDVLMRGNHARGEVGGWLWISQIVRLSLEKKDRKQTSVLHNPYTSSASASLHEFVYVVVPSEELNELRRDVVGLLWDK